MLFKKYKISVVIRREVKYLSDKIEISINIPYIFLFLSWSKLDCSQTSTINNTIDHQRKY